MKFWIIILGLIFFASILFAEYIVRLDENTEKSFKNARKLKLKVKAMKMRKQNKSN